MTTNAPQVRKTHRPNSTFIPSVTTSHLNSRFSALSYALLTANLSDNSLYIRQTKVETRAQVVQLPTSHLVHLKHSVTIKRRLNKVVQTLNLITRSLTNVRLSSTLTRQISSLLIIHNRRSHHTNTISNIRRLRSTRQHYQVRISNKLVNRRSLQVIRVHTNSNRALLLATKRLVQMIILLANRSRNLRRLQRRQLSNKPTHTSRLGHRHRVLPRNLIHRRLMVLRRRSSKAAVLQRLAIHRATGVVTNRSGLTIHNLLLTRRRTRRHHLTKAKDASRGRRVTAFSIRISVVRHQPHALKVRLTRVVRYSRYRVISSLTPKTKDRIAICSSSSTT